MGLVSVSKVAFDEFKSQGFTLIRGVSDAQGACDSFLESVRSEWSFGSRIVLDNVARVPHKSCQDAVKTSHLSMHFEMGLPLVPVEDKTRVHALICLHIPPGEKASPVATRLLPIDGLLSGASGVEQRLIDYVKKHGAGWQEFNSGRLLVAAQLIDAMQDKTELAFMREHRIAEWFNRDAKNSSRDGREAEQAFFARGGVNLKSREKSFVLQPGDLLIVDNLRVAHGREGQRPAEELLQLLYGVKDATREEIKRLSVQVAARIASSKERC